MLANRIRSRASRAFLLALFVFSTSCGDSPTGSTPEPVAVARVEVASASERVAAGDTVQLTATARDAAGNAIGGKAMQWASDNPAVVKVDASTGRATGESVGSATITASADGQSGRVTLAVVPQPVASLAVSRDTATLVAGTGTQLHASARDRRGVPLSGRAVAWSSSAEGVARVDGAGMVTAVAPGTATITAASEGQNASARITVVPVPVARVAIAPDTATLVVGASLPLAVSALDAAGNLLAGRAAVLVSSNAAVATLDGSRVTAVAPGSVTITATVEGRTATATITVVRVPIATLSIDPPSATVVVGTPLQLAIVARDAAGNTLAGRSITIATSDLGVAGVNAAGQVLGIAPGVATITATAEGRTAISTITVIPVPIASLTISPDSASITVGQQLGLAITARDAGGAILGGRAVVLATSDAAVATVSAAGTVYGVATGVATITATAEGKTATAKVVVRPAAVASVTISPSSATLPRGSARDFDAVARDANGAVLTGRAVSWSTSDAAVASVSSAGTVTANGLGTVVISATVEGRHGQATVTVTAPAGGDTQAPTLTGMSFTPSAVDVTTGSRTVDFTFTATDAGSGVQGIEVYLTAPANPDGSIGPSRSCYASTLSAGTRSAGTFRCSVILPQGSAAGQWSVGIVYAGDALSNRRSYSEAALAAAGYATRIQVAN